MTRFSVFFLMVLIILFYGSSHTPQTPQPSNLDFSALDEFWKITSTLTKDIEPDDNDWQALFNTPGYAGLTQSEFSKDYFKNYFRLAYMPGKKKLLKKELTGTHWRVQYLKHMMKVLPEKEKIEKHRKKLISSNYITKEALELTKKYFPDGELGSDDLPQICFVVFGNDARGYENIIIDILFSSEQGDKLKYLVGHEAHHFYRNKRLAFNFPGSGHPDYHLVWVLNQILAEGIADHIDKRVMFFDGGDMVNSKWALKYKEYLKTTPQLINKMDKLFARYGSQSEGLHSISEELRKIIPMSGHPTGYYMAGAIIKNLGKNELLKHIGNPFQFFMLYNQVAQTHTGRYPAFSKETLNLINRLESAYLKK